MAEVIIIDNGEATSSKKWRWLWVLFVIILIITVGIGGFVVWALNPTLEIDPIAYDAIESSDNITVTDRAWLAFLPHTPPETGLIIYPGARVPPIAFAPLARQVAENGYLVVIAYPPINLALLNPTMATPIMEHFSGVEHWVVGGHSLGGSVAGSYSADNSSLIG
ncbi:MAG: alpha/beta hydrolase [Chloroflexota bacterium]